MAVQPKAPKWFTIEKSLIARMERWIEEQDITEVSVERHWGPAYDYIQRFLPSVAETKKIEGLGRDSVCWLTEHVLTHVLIGGAEDCTFCHPGRPQDNPRWWLYISAIVHHRNALRALKASILRGDVEPDTEAA